MIPRLIGIRGAISIDRDESEAMRQAIGSLMDAIMEHNNLIIDDLVTIQFTQTADLKQENAATALRKARADSFDRVPLFCAWEPDVVGMPGLMVRILVTAYAKQPAHAVYLKDAKNLRPEL